MLVASATRHWQLMKLTMAVDHAALSYCYTLSLCVPRALCLRSYLPT